MPIGIYKRSKENIEKMRLRMIGKPGYWTGKKRPDMSGNNHFYFGKERTKEVRNKISITKKGVPQTLIAKKNIKEGHTRGNKHPLWKGGKIKNDTGYSLIRYPDHPYASNSGYVREHRYIVEKIIGRYLISKESVHHINRIRNDNRPENLMAFINDIIHHKFHIDPNNVKPEEIIFDGRLL